MREYEADPNRGQANAAAIAIKVRLPSISNIEGLRSEAAVRYIPFSFYTAVF